MAEIRGAMQALRYPNAHVSTWCSTELNGAIHVPMRHGGIPAAIQALRGSAFALGARLGGALGAGADHALLEALHAVGDLDDLVERLGDLVHRSLR